MTHRSVSPSRRITTPVKINGTGQKLPLPSALKKRNGAEFERTTSAGGFSDAKSAGGPRADSPLKQAQFDLKPSAPLEPPTDGSQKKGEKAENYNDKTVEELDVVIEDLNNALEKKQKE